MSKGIKKRFQIAVILQTRINGRLNTNRIEHRDCSFIDVNHRGDLLIKPSANSLNPIACYRSGSWFTATREEIPDAQEST